MENRGLSAESKHYPYVVVRLFAAVYSKYEIHFDPSAASAVVNEPARRLTVPGIDEPRSAGSEAAVVTGRRQAAVEAVRDWATASGRRMCVVFEFQDCVFVEPDGTTQASTEPPHGGITSDELDRMTGGPQRQS